MKSSRSVQEPAVGCRLSAVGRPDKLPSVDRSSAVSRRPSALQLAVIVLLLLAGGAVLRAELPGWIQNLEATNPFRVAIVKVVSMPSGAVNVRRPPRESRAALNDLIARTPTNNVLVAMRARTEEEQLDFAAAEQDWQRYVQLVPDKTAGLFELADFYRRRLRPADEVLRA